MKTGADWLQLTGLCLLVSVVAIVTRPLLPVDETRYLSVAWEMWQRQDFLVPYLNGEPYSHKPPLLFWLIHAIWSITGVHAAPARLLAPLLALVALWLSTTLARRLWPTADSGSLQTVPWVILGGWFWMLFMTLVQFDLLVTVMALLAWHGLLLVERRPWAGWLMTGVATGLGILSKGPVIFLFVLPVAILAPIWRQTSSGWTAWYAGLVASVLLAAGIALAWAIPATTAGGAAYREAIFWSQSAGRVVDAFAHRNPWWSYLAVLPLLLLPWLVWPAVWRGLRRLTAVRHEPGMRFMLLVLMSVLVLFSLISGKQAKYIVPVLPLLAILVTRLLALVTPDRRSLPAIRWVTVSSAALLLVLHLTLVPVLRPAYDLAPVSQRLSDLQKQRVPLAYLGKYHGQFHFLGRLTRPVEALSYGGDDFLQWLAQHPQGILVAYDRASGQAIPASVYKQPYRSGRLVLWPVAMLLNDRRRLDALLTNA